jgi:histone H2B
MRPTKGGQRPPKSGSVGAKGSGGKRAPLPGSVNVAAAGGGKASVASGGTRTLKSSKKAASESNRTGAAAAGKRGKKKRGGGRRAAWQRWSSYIHKLQNDERKIGLSRRAMAIVGAFVEDMFERLTTQASQVARMNKLATVTAKEVQTAARLMLPTDFAAHSIAEGTRAVTRFNREKEAQQE